MDIVEWIRQNTGINISRRLLGGGRLSSKEERQRLATDHKLSLWSAVCEGLKFEWPDWVGRKPQLTNARIDLHHVDPECTGQETELFAVSGYRAGVAYNALCRMVGGRWPDCRIEEEAPEAHHFFMAMLNPGNHKAVVSKMLWATGLQPTDEWHEDFGDCLFFHFENFEEPPTVTCATPLETGFNDGEWTHFIRIDLNNVIAQAASMEGGL